MSENNARLERDLYDHEHDESRSSGARRRRPVADWGVGDDVFEHMPRNRFSRAAEGPPRERRFSPHGEPGERRAEPADGEAESADRGAAGERRAEPAGRGAGDERRAVSAGGGAEPAGRSPEPAGDDDGVAVDRDAADRPRERDVPRVRLEDGRRTIRIGRPEDVPSEIAAITADRDIGDDPVRAPEAAAEPPAPAAAAPGERRTIRIGGRPEGSLEATRAQRRRPPRTAHERVGARPDRVAAWAVALGLLLILIAVLTAL